MELWAKFCSLCPDFITSYAAYHHFRSRGWVPKGGGAAKYGADLSKTPRLTSNTHRCRVSRLTWPFCCSAVQERPPLLPRQVRSRRSVSARGRGPVCSTVLALSSCCSYSVVIERVNDVFMGSALRPFSWRSLAALSRITASVSKVRLLLTINLVTILRLFEPDLLLVSQELMLCYIIYPADLPEPELDSPECLRRLKVQVIKASFNIST